MIRRQIITIFGILYYEKGEMAEWSNAAVSKTVVRLPVNRGFESPSLRKGIAEGSNLTAKSAKKALRTQC